MPSSSNSLSLPSSFLLSLTRISSKPAVLVASASSLPRTRRASAAITVSITDSCRASWLAPRPPPAASLTLPSIAGGTSPAVAASPRQQHQGE